MTSQNKSIVEYAWLPFILFRARKASQSHRDRSKERAVTSLEFSLVRFRQWLRRGDKVYHCCEVTQPCAFDCHVSPPLEELEMASCTRRVPRRSRCPWCPSQVLLSVLVRTYSIVPPNLIASKMTPFCGPVSYQLTVKGHASAIASLYFRQIFYWLKFRDFHTKYTTGVFNWPWVYSSSAFSMFEL